MTDQTHAQLREALLESLKSPSDSRRHAVVSEVLNVFPFDELPTPGTARGWSTKDWTRWFDDHGFEQQPQSAHSYPFYHPRLCLTTSIPTTPGDWRWSMNQASDIRRSVRVAFDAWEPIFISALTTLADLQGPVNGDPDPLSFLRVLATRYIGNREDFSQALEQALQDGKERGGATAKVTVREVRSVLNKLETEFGASYRASLQLIGVDANTIESLLLLIRGPQDCLVSAFLLSMLRDVLDTKRALAAAEREHKQAERERERAEREATKAAATTPAGQLRAQVTMMRNALLSNHANAARQLAEAVTRVEHLGHALRDLAIVVPQDLDAVAAPARLAELEAKATAQQEEIAAQETEIAQHLATIAELRILARERDELLATPDWRVPFDRFLVDAERLLAEDNFMRLAGNIAKLQARIEQERAALQMPTTKDTVPVTSATNAGA